MVRKRYTPEQILAKLRDSEVLASRALGPVEIAREMEVSEQAFLRWRNQNGGIKGDGMRQPPGIRSGQNLDLRSELPFDLE